MTIANVSPADPRRAKRWICWVDGCGGFLLVVGGSVQLGGGDPNPLADVALRADLPRMAGSINRDGSEYFWQPTGMADRTWLESGKQMTLQTAVKIKLVKPSPLSSSARLEVASPHRFGHHVDAVVLADQTVLMGPGVDCHLRCRQLSQTWIIIHRAGQWQLRPSAIGATASPAASQTNWIVLKENQPTTIEQVGMTLETLSNEEWIHDGC